MSECVRYNITNMKPSLLNLPTYIVTILIRKFLDIQSKSPAKILTRGPWIIEDVLNSENIYVYIIGATLAFFIANIKKGLISHFTAKFPMGGKSKFTQNYWLQRNNSWLLRNLLGTRENQQKALSLLSAQIPLSSNVIDKRTLMDSVKKDAPKKKPSRPKLTLPVDESPRKEESKTSFYSVIEDARPHYKDQEVSYKETAKERGDGESRNMFLLERQHSGTGTSELFTSSVLREIIPSDGSEEDMPMMKVKRKQRKTKKDFRFKVPQRPLHSTIRRTRSGRIYNFGYMD